MMFIGSRHTLKKTTYVEPITIDGKDIPQITTKICLGVKFDGNLNWENHIKMICKKVSSGIGVMKRMKPFVPVNTLETVYKSLVLPYFDYCCPLWDTCGKILRDKLQRF